MRRSVLEFGFVWTLVLLGALSVCAQMPPGPVLKEHGMLSGPGHCTDCHDLGKGKPEFKCLSCHSGIQEDQKTGRHLPLDGGASNGLCAGCHSLHSAGGTASVDTEKKAAKTDCPHGAVGISCRNCHTSTSYKPIRPFPDFTHAKTRFPLRGMHVGLDCKQCHAKPVFASVGKQCADCHADLHRRQLGGNCEQCHTVRGWRVTMTAVNNHANRFPLLGAHAATDCESCHKTAATGQYRGLSIDCVSCHRRDYASAKSPDHQAAGFSETCRACHAGMDSWTGAKFSHSGSGGFLLTGGHAQLDCTACHENRKFTGTSSDCASCHAKDYAAAADPNHAAAGFSRNCQTCHSSVGWASASFDHGTSAKFKLTGAHTSVDCQACHQNGKYTGTPTSCYSCHSTDFNAAKTPVHVSGTFSTDCTTCHNSVSWKGGAFDHNLSTFRLTGAHVGVQCATCHKNNVYTGLPTGCASCHLTAYNGTTNPNHASAGFPQQCSTCHNTASWAGATFNHGTTPFPLTGSHTSVQCATCHKNNIYAGLPTACVSCHLNEYKSTTNPNHTSAGLPQDCSQCHNSLAWQGGTSLNHNTQTQFPLTGAHTGVQCTTCHKNNVYAGLSTACASCHLADYTGTTNPSHASAGFPQQCSTCHNSTSWAGATFNHGTTPFPLTGAHTGVECATCHKNNVYAGLSTACASCHLTAYNGTTNPSHASAGFPQDCSLCHSTSSFSGASFNHGSTPFPLTGAHITVICTTCHKNNVYAGLSTGCSSCHLSEYSGTTNPNHASAGFPQQCSTCHSTASWAGAAFNHGATPFSLTGAHTSVQCNLCHINDKYAGTPTDCYSCHSAEYKSTTNPGHPAAGFPTTCASCHTTAAWTGATFNHTWWKTNHGSARTCGDCHANPADYSVFSCTTCHTKAQMDSKHAGRSGYLYNSANCYQCHRSGGGD